MPGIAGMISRRPAVECEAIVKAMTQSMMHEEFYTPGFYSAPAMGIYAGWVVLENSFAAGQVFFNEQKDVALIFSGECFADREDLAQLESRGHDLGDERGDWLVHLYEEQGEQLFGKLNGLFSGLLIDKRKKCAFLFNDRYGVERIYVHETADALYFASEAKALLRILPELRAFDEEGVTQFLAFGCTLEWRTLFRGISVLPGGSLWHFEGGRCRKERYFNPVDWEKQEPLTAEDFEAEFQETFKRILPRYFESETGIGISLTGGLDTRMIMASRPVTNEKPACYTFGGESGETLDAQLAARVAESCGLDHQVLRIGPDFFADFGSLADRTVCVTDGCFGVLGAHEIYLNRMARELAPVRLTGNFGSEVLRSMCTFKPIELLRNSLNPEFVSRVNIAENAVSNPSEHPVTFAAFREIPWNLFGSLAAGRSQVSFRTPYLDNEIVRLAFRAPEMLRRTPVPALRFVKKTSPSLSKIPTDRGLMADAPRMTGAARRFFSDVAFKLEYHTNEGLPNWLSNFDPFFRILNSIVGVFGRHKYLHYRRWLRNELAHYLNAAIDRASSRPSPFWNQTFVRQLGSAHISGRGNYLRELNAVLTLEAVDRLFLRNHPSSSELLTNSATQLEAVAV
jgi:asparagine synthase (glutamine-hydrolysing)